MGRRRAIRSTSSGSSAGPFTTTVVAASNLSVGSGVIIIFSYWGSPDRVSTLSRPGTYVPYPASYPERPAEGASHHVPVSCCLSTVGFRFSIIRFPPGSWAFLTVGLPVKQHRTPTGVTAFRTHELRPGWVPPVPRGRRCSSRLRGLLNRRLPLLSGQSLYSAAAFHRRSSSSRDISQRFRVLHPSDLPLACGPRMERALLGFCLMLRTPPGTPATHVRPRPGPEHGPGTTPSIFVEPPINVFTHMRATSRRKPCGRLSRPPWCGVTRTTTMGTPSPWGSRPAGDPAFVPVIRPSTT